MCLGVNLYESTLCGAFEHLGYAGECFPSNLWNFQPLFLQLFFTCPFLTPRSSRTSITVVLVNLWCATGLWGFVHFSSFFFFSSPDWISMHPSSSSQIPFACSYVLFSCTTDFFHFVFVLLSSRVSISFHNLCLFIDIFYFVRCCYHTLILYIWFALALWNT